MRPFISACCLLSSLTLAACDSPDLLAPSDVTGTYLLRSVADVSGDTPTSGLLYIRPDGEVERRLIFAASEPYELVTIGRFRVRNAVLEIAFWPDDTESGQLHFRPVAYRPDYIMLTHPRPDDGPDTIEVYQKATISAQ